MKVVCLRERRAVREADLSGEALRVERSDAERDERAGIAEDGVL